MFSNENNNGPKFQKFVIMMTPFVFLSTMTATAASSSSFGYVSSLWMPNASSTEHRGYHFTLASPVIGGGGGVTVFACGISGELTVVDYSTPEHPVPIANLTGPQLLQSRTMLWYARLAHVCLKLKRGFFYLKKKRLNYLYAVNILSHFWLLHKLCST